VDADQVDTLRALLANSGWLERVRVFGRALRTSTRTPGGLLVVGTPEDEPWHLTAHLDEESRLSRLPVLMPTLVRWSPPPDAPPHLRVGLERLEAARRGETLFVVSEETAPVPLLERVNDARHVGATILALDGGDRELDALAHETLAVPRREAPTGPAGRPPGGLAGRPAGEPAGGQTGRPAGGQAGRQAGGPAGESAPEAVPAFGRGGFDEAEWAGRAGLLSFDAAQHLISAAAGERDVSGAAQGGSRGARGLRDRLARLLDAVSGPST
jgi:hypothetical protein